MNAAMRGQHVAGSQRLGTRTRMVCLLSAVSCLLSGCVRRSLTIRTDPPQASVYLNDRLIGQTPVTYDFEWYGWHRVILRKDGYERIEDRKLLRSPIYLWIPLDLIAELLPVPVRDRREWSYTLRPMETPPAPVPPEETPRSEP